MEQLFSFHVHLKNQRQGHHHQAQGQRDRALGTLWRWWPLVWPHCTMRGFVSDRRMSNKDRGLRPQSLWQDVA